jgi:hypothetical protein
MSLSRLSGGLQEDAWEEEEDKDDRGAEEAGEGRAGPAKQLRKKTATDRNRAARAREQDTALEARQKLKQQRRDLQNLKALEQELAGVLVAPSSLARFTLLQASKTSSSILLSSCPCVCSTSREERCHAVTLAAQSCHPR